MPEVTVSTQYSEREDFVYSFALLSDIYQRDRYYQNEQLPKIVADIKKDLQTELKEYAYLLPLFCYKSYKLSLFSNCRRMFIPEAEDLVLSTEQLISRVLTDDPDELTARVFMTVDNNAGDISLYRKLVEGSIEAVRHCLNMDIDEELRTVLLSMLVDRKEYHAKMTEFAFRTLNVLRDVFIRRDFAVKKASSIFEKIEVVLEDLQNIGYVSHNDKVIITPITLNPGVIYMNNHGGVKYFRIGFDYERSAVNTAGLYPTLELETIGKIFGDPTRCEIIRMLKTNSSYLTDLARRLNIPTNSLHYHIQTLSDAGVIKGSYRGKRFVYDLNPQFFKSASNTVIDFAH